MNYIHSTQLHGISSWPSSMTLWGVSAFTTLLVRNNEPIYFADHCDRLAHDCAAIGLMAPDNAALVDVVMSKLQEQPTTSLQRLRITIAETMWSCELSAYRAPSSLLYSEGVRIAPTSHQVHPQLFRVKSGNYLPYVLARAEAEQQGAFEGLLVNYRGSIVDGSRTSLMWWNDDVLHLVDGGLAGIMRQHALRYAEKTLGQSVSRIDLQQHHLTSGQLLLSSSLLGVIPVGVPINHVIRELVGHFIIED